jgi:hypothetical protein
MGDAAKIFIKEPLTLPYCGSRKIDTRIILHPDMCFPHPRHRYSWKFLRRPVSVPVKISLCSARGGAVETVTRIVPGSPVVLDFRCILDDNGLPPEDDYTFEFLIELSVSGPVIEFQMKGFDCPIWGSVYVRWPRFRQADRGFAMLNPKFKITNQDDTLALLCYPSDSPDMPETNRIRYLFCDEQGEVLVKGETVVRKNSFVLIPEPSEREMLQGNCTMYAQADQAMASITLNRNLTSNAIDLEHTQLLQKYLVTKSAGGTSSNNDLKEYWSRKVVNT